MMTTTFCVYGYSKRYPRDCVVMTTFGVRGYSKRYPCGCVMSTTFGVHRYSKRYLSSVARCHAERKRSIYGIAQQSNVSTLREILHFVQNDNVSVYVIARRASPDVAISSKPTRDNVDSVLSLRRFFASLRMT